MDLSHSSGDSTSSTPNHYANIRCALGVRLTEDQLELLAQAFADSDLIFVKREFRSGYSGALVLLVSLGANQAPLVVKLAHPFDLEREYQAYQQFVRQISPQNIAHLRGAPLIGSGGQLGLIQYTFAGGESHQAAASLKDYYESNGGAASAVVLNRIFRAYGRYWWANNRPELYTLGEQYDRLLPVHLQVAKITSATTTAHLLEPGKTSLLTVRQLQVGETLRLIAFQAMKVQAGGREITLVAPPPPHEASAILRIRLELNEGEELAWQVRPGDTVAQVDVVITATRLTLLCDAATEAAPSFDPKIEAFTLDIGGETHERAAQAAAENPKLLNPLFDLSGLLDQVVETKFSTIHGDLNLQNILVDMPTGFAWLIDFGETRSGPTLLDPQRLEVQAITRLLPEALRDSGLKPVEVAKLYHLLHSDPLPSTPPHPALLEPFQFLVTIRRIARQYLIDDLDWDEYYRGMIVTLVGALKYKELDSSARSMALIAAATLQGLLGHPLKVNQPAPLPPPSSSRPAFPAIGWAALGVGVVILLVVLSTLWQGWSTPAVPQSEPTPAPTDAPTVAPTDAPTVAIIAASATPLVVENDRPAISIYDDDLAEGWEYWSWDVDILNDETSPHDGAASLRVAYLAPYSGLSLRSITPLPSNAKQAVDFWIYKEQGDSRIVLYAMDNLDTGEGPQITLPVPRGKWTHLTVPFSQLGNLAQIALLVWQEDSGNDDAVFYFDDIRIIESPADAASTTGSE